MSCLKLSVCVFLGTTLLQLSLARADHSINNLPGGDRPGVSSDKSPIEYLEEIIPGFEVQKEWTEKLRCVVVKYDRGYKRDVPLDAPGKFMGYQPMGISSRLGGREMPVGSFDSKDACERQILAAHKAGKICSRDYDEGAGTIIDAPNPNATHQYMFYDLKERRHTRPASKYIKNADGTYQRQEVKSKFATLKECLETLFDVEKSTASNEDVGNFTQPNPTNIFLKGFEKAKKYAKSKNGLELRFRGTGILARDLAVTVNPIEVQEVLAKSPGGEWKVVGTILPEKNHLTTLKTSEEVFQEVKGMLE